MKHGDGPGGGKFLRYLCTFSSTSVKLPELRAFFRLHTLLLPLRSNPCTVKFSRIQSRPATQRKVHRSAGKFHGYPGMYLPFFKKKKNSGREMNKEEEKITAVLTSTPRTFLAYRRVEPGAGGGEERSSPLLQLAVIYGFTLPRPMAAGRADCFLICA